MLLIRNKSKWQNCRELGQFAQATRREVIFGMLPDLQTFYIDESENSTE
jgi:hypothetical protein